MKLTYISILRSLSILVVVFFHVYQYMYGKYSVNAVLCA